MLVSRADTSIGLSHSRSTTTLSTTLGCNLSLCCSSGRWLGREAAQSSVAGLMCYSLVLMLVWTIHTLGSDLWPSEVRKISDMFEKSVLLDFINYLMCYVLVMSLFRAHSLTFSPQTLQMSLISCVSGRRLTGSSRENFYFLIFIWHLKGFMLKRDILFAFKNTICEHQVCFYCKYQSEAADRNIRNKRWRCFIVHSGVKLQ